MEEIDQKILSKIKKCLALSGSDNPHEAAAALRQAHAMMEKYGVTSHIITMSDIGEAKIKSHTMSRDKPAAWEMRLAAIVGKAFGCKMMVSRKTYRKGCGHANEGEYIFVGLKQQVTVAAYTANVLVRKCKTLRKNWLNEHMGGLSIGVAGMKKKMTRMGDMFAEGWVTSITKLVHEFANPAEIDEAINAHVDSQVNGEAQARSLKREDIGRHDQIAAIAGMRAAQGESLYRAMEKDNDVLRLEHC